MRYVICDKEKAERAHISLIGHYVKDGEVMLNEKEVTVCSVLDGDLAERAEELGGVVYEYIEAMTKLIEGGWQHE